MLRCVCVRCVLWVFCLMWKNAYLEYLDISQMQNIVAGRVEGKRSSGYDYAVHNAF